jgi:hypothetical protein
MPVVAQVCYVDVLLQKLSVSATIPGAFPRFDLALPVRKDETGAYAGLIFSFCPHITRNAPFWHLALW